MAETVLVIDDNVGFRRAVAGLLSQGVPRFEVVGAASAREALSRLALGGVRPAFVILDFHLPDQNAPEVLRILRRQPETRDLAVLVLTQANWEADEQAALGSGATRFDVKPSRISLLHQLLIGFWRDAVAR